MLMRGAANLLIRLNVLRYGVNLGVEPIFDEGEGRIRGNVASMAGAVGAAAHVAARAARFCRHRRLLASCR